MTLTDPIQNEYIFKENETSPTYQGEILRHAPDVVLRRILLFSFSYFYELSCKSNVCKIIAIL